VKARDLRLVVCAAIKNKAGIVVCGPRHGDCLNVAVKYGIDPLPNSEHWECGFVDQENKFMSRAEAWTVADQAGQIRRPTGFEKDYANQRPANMGDTGLLFSENLY
jgi:hypothetical protein